MSHDATKVLMGSTRSSEKTVDNFEGALAAGSLVRQKPDGDLTLLSAEGEVVGISLGKDLSNTTRTAVCRKGLSVPVLIKAGFTPTLRAQVAISDTTGVAEAAGAGVTAMNAQYSSGRLVGVAEDGTEVGVALVDFVGGL